MFDFPGVPIPIDRFGPFDPVEEFAYYDRPLSFSFDGTDGQRYLAHWWDEDKLNDLWLVVPLPQATRDAMVEGRIPVRDVLFVPELCVIATGMTGLIDRAWSVDTASLPDDAFPAAGVTLYRNSGPDRCAGQDG